MTGYAGSRDYVGISQSFHTYIYIPLKNRLRPYVLDLLRRLRGPYIIPRPGVPRHIPDPPLESCGTLVEINQRDVTESDTKCVKSSKIITLISLLESCC